MDDEETKQLRNAALKNAQTILSARVRAERELREMREALEEQTRVLDILNKTAAILATNLDLKSMVQTVTDAAREVSGAAFAAYFYTANAADTGMRTNYTLSGPPRAAFEKLGPPRDTPMFAPTFAGQGVIRSDDITKDPRYGQLPPHFGMPPGHPAVRSYLAVPVVLRSGEVIGGLFFGHPEIGVFTAKSELVVMGIAGQASAAFESSRMFDEAKRLADAERTARAEVERVSLMKDEFLATLSHELRTPLNAVLGWSQLLISRGNNNEETQRGLATIARNAQSQAQIIDDLLDMNRIMSGKLRLDVQRVDLTSIVEGALDSIAPSTQSKSICVRTTLDPLVGPVFGDPQRLQQVIWNLLSNAVKFTPKSGTIDVLLRRVNSHMEISVIDSGIGIDAQFLPHLFERFRQADSSTTRRYGGLGLGLAIAKEIVELHGGSVRAESPGVGLGATVVVSLPVRVLREDDQVQHPTTPRPFDRKRFEIDLLGVKVLVVDDEKDAADLLARVLGEVRAEVMTASSANEALAILASFRPSVLVSDIGMPERDGYELLRDVRALPEGQGGRIPAVAVTAFARSEDRMRALMAGYQVHISKPIDVQELVVTIASLTDRFHGS